jgi:hypothetical protein
VSSNSSATKKNYIGLGENIQLMLLEIPSQGLAAPFLLLLVKAQDGDGGLCLCTHHKP